MSLRLPAGQASGERNEGLPARVEQKREHRSVSAGRSDFAQRIAISEVLRSEAEQNLGAGFREAVAGYSVLSDVLLF